LAARLRPTRVILAGEMPGVLRFDPRGIAADSPGLAEAVIELITPSALEESSHFLGDSRGVDVTGGMLSKVREMACLLQAVPALRCVQLVSGLRSGLVRSVLVDANLRPGTTIQRTAEG
jgi:isopentenyl phosphate kinase